MELYSLNLQRYEIGIKGLSCINCVNSLKDALAAITDLYNLTISFIQERMLVSISKEETLDEIKNVIDSLNFEITRIKNISEATSENSRLLKFTIKSQDSQAIRTLNLIWKELGSSCKVQTIKNLYIIDYNTLHIRAEQIIQKLEESGISFELQKFEYMDNSPAEVKSDFRLSDVFIAIFSTIYLTIVSFILPPYVSDNFEMYPQSWGMFSIYLITNWIIGTGMLLLYGRKFLIKAWKSYRSTKNTNMMTLVSLGTLAAYIFSLVYIIWGLYYQFSTSHNSMNNMNSMNSMNQSVDLLEFIRHSSHMLQTMTTIVSSVVVGKFLESKAKKQIFKEISTLKPRMEVSGKETLLFIPKNKFYDELSTRLVDPILIEKGDLIKVEPGLLCFDAILVKGQIKVIDNVKFGREDAEIRSTGDVLRSGSEIISSDNGILLVDNPIEKSILSKVYNEVMEASMKPISETDSQKRLDKITKYFVNMILIITLLTFGTWLIVIQLNYYYVDMGWTYAVERGLSVLVVSCPCALGMAIPIVYSTSLNIALANQILVKDGSLFSIIKTIDTVLFDKTGTLTSKYNIAHKERLDQAYESVVLWDIIKVIEQKYISHPIGQTLYQEALKFLELTPIKSRVKNRVYVQSEETIQTFPAEGLYCSSLHINNLSHKILLGNSKLLNKYNVRSTTELEEAIFKKLEKSTSKETLESYSKTWLCIDNEPQLLILIDNENSIRSSSRELIKVIKTKLKKDMYLVTGDLKDCAIQTGLSLGIDINKIKYEQEPHMKEELIKQLQAQGKKVLMIGDGLNDLRAYQAADISVAINYKTSKNLSTAQIILLNNDLMSLLVLFKLAKWSESIKNANLAASFTYNILAIPIAAGVLYPSLGYDLPPDQACWAMAFSSLLVILITLSMKFINFTKEKQKVNEVDVIETNPNEIRTSNKQPSPLINALQSKFMKASTRMMQSMQINTKKSPLFELQPEQEALIDSIELVKHNSKSNTLPPNSPAESSASSKSDQLSRESSKAEIKPNIADILDTKKNQDRFGKGMV